MKSHMLGELCEFVRGTSPTLKTQPGRFPLVVTAAYRRSADTWQVEGPAVCIPLISSTGHGDAAMHRIHYQEGKFALANLLVALLPRDPAICDAKYLQLYLTAQKDRLLVPLMLGTANVSLKEKDIARVKIPLPPVEQQRRVVARIEGVAEQVRETLAGRCDQEISTRRLLSSVFWNLASAAPRLPMSEVAPITRRQVEVVPEGSYPEVGIRSFGRGTFLKAPLSGLEVATKRIFRIEEGDLLFSNVFAWEGAIAIARAADHGRFASHRFMTCPPVPTLAVAEFLRFYFLTDEGLDVIRAASPGGAGRNRTLGVEALQKIEVPVPPMAEQEWFSDLCTQCASLFNLLVETAEDLNALVPATVNHAFWVPVLGTSEVGQSRVSP